MNIINLIFTFISINWFLIFTPFFNFTSFNWFLIWSFFITILLILNHPFLDGYYFNTIINIDTYSELTLLIFTSLFIIYLYGIFNSSVKNYKELPLLLLITYFGFTTLIVSNDLLMLYLSIELFSLTFYLITTIHQNYYTTEAGIKYFIYNFIAGGFYLLGCVLIYLDFGTINFVHLAELAQFGKSQFGFLFILISFFFKLSIAPFHFWTPDIYVGVLYPITAYFTIFPKYIIGAFLLKFYIYVINVGNINNLFLFLSVLSIFIGTIGGLNQSNIKRLLAYSTISNAGFIVLLIYFGTPLSSQIFHVYVLTYIIANLGLFTSLINLNISNMLGLKNIFTLNPLGGIFLAIPILSLAGLPPFIGFMAKFLSIFVLLSKNWFVVATVILLLSVLSLFYYLRLVHYIFFYSNNSSKFVPQDLTADSSKDWVPTADLYQSYIIIISNYILITSTMNPSILILISSVISNSLFIS